MAHNRVKEISEKSGHLEAAMRYLCGVLIYSPRDPKGLWIHKAIAIVLNVPDAENIRSGFKTKTYKAHGVHSLDTTGKQEKDLAKQFQNKVEELENAGFHRFAITLRELAKGYER